MNKLNRILSAALLCAALSPSAALSAAPDAPDALTGNWSAALNRGAFETLADMYTADAVVTTPALEIHSARAAIRSYWEKQRAGGAGAFALESVDVHIDGDTAYQTAVWAATVTSNGTPTEFEGEMTNVLRRQPDGSWKISLQSWN